MNSNKIDPVGPDLIGALQAARGHIVLHVSEGGSALHRGPRRPPADVHGTLADPHQTGPDEHLRQLCAVLALGDLRPFTDYLQWLASVQRHRGLPADLVADDLALMRSWIAGRIYHAEAAAALAVLDHGIALLGTPDEPGPAPADPATPPSVRVDDYTRTLLDGHRDGAVDQLLAAMGRGASLVDVSVDLVQPALYEVGRLWQQNRIGVAQEHLASAISQNALAAGFARARFAPPNGRHAAFACVADNHHGIGLRMISDAFEVAGWDVDFLGADTPTESIVSFVCANGPDLLGLSASLTHQVVTVRDIIERLRAELGNAAPAIIIGGLPFNAFGCSALATGADDCFPDARAALDAAGGAPAAQPGV